MTNEIKEILDFKEDADYKRLSVDEIVILEDYITNLQQRIDKAIEYIINHTQSTAHLEMDTKSIKQLLDILRGDE